MALGTALAVGLGSAVIGAGASYAGAKANSKATKKAAAAQERATAEQTALQRDIYNQNKGALSPFMQRGNAAGDAINELLLGRPAAAPQPSALSGQPMPAQGLPIQPGGMPGALEFDWNGDGMIGFKDILARREQAQDWNQQRLSPAPQTAAPQGGTQPSAMSAYEQFKQSAGYQTRLTEGQNALNASFAGRGLSQSGAAVKSALRYGQDFASNEFGKYLGYLGNQQGVGLSGASALAGVGQSYANNMGDISQNQANATAAAASAKAANNNALYGSLAGIAGNVAGGFAPGGFSSYGPVGGVFGGGGFPTATNPALGVINNGRLY